MENFTSNYSLLGAETSEEIPPILWKRNVHCEPLLLEVCYCTYLKCLLFIYSSIKLVLSTEVSL
jgi:hypothetical protein